MESSAHNNTLLKQEGIAMETSFEKEHTPFNIKVLLYHRIVKDELLRRVHWSYVSTEQLRRHLELLNTCGFTPVTFKDYLLAAEGRLRLPKKPVILTFENGYLNTYKYAFPILKEFGFNAVVFAIGNRTLKTDDWNMRIGLEPEQLASDDELREMSEAGFEIGSQSLTNVDLTALPMFEVEQEIKGSKETLETVLKTDVVSFSYPFGIADEKTKRLTSDAGYKIACGADSSPSNGGTDPLEIRRLTMTSSTNSLSFAIRILAPSDQTDWMQPKGSVIYRRAGRETAAVEMLQARSLEDATAST